MAQRENLFEVFPRSDLTKRIEAENEIIRFAAAAVFDKIADRIDGVGNSGPVDFYGGDSKVSISGGRQSDHLQPVSGWRCWLVFFVRRNGSRDEKDSIERKSFPDLFSTT